MLRRFTSW